MAQSKPRRIKTAVKRTESLLDLANDLKLLELNVAVSHMGQARELCEQKVKELIATNGTLHKVSIFIISRSVKLEQFKLPTSENRSSYIS